MSTPQKSAENHRYTETEALVIAGLMARFDASPYSEGVADPYQEAYDLYERSREENPEHSNAFLQIRATELLLIQLLGSEERFSSITEEYLDTCEAVGRNDGSLSPVVIRYCALGRLSEKYQFSPDIASAFLKYTEYTYKYPYIGMKNR